ncbi:TPA: hypothetical protein CPT98_00320 [Candidatus Gastranaerophilales bacterium HUM_19]|nr:MAG TPA: hypothetical protein CPT97_10715 [Candidatus Gastranaerophilales bacterium HUM_17]DAB19939.1 MAG TPA: hypothetical protein CPT98_00320 [Candidatus Gastranaerophilales bacterium HUM_19]DAB24896.1 MAG TPA: hypothetical protein CPT86_08860 [Candidatus Gastranaerophilales bacterium HUM_23]
MSKMKLFKQAEQMYLKGSTVSEISLQLGIAKRTLFYWKKKYDWDKKWQEAMYDKTLFKEDLQKFAKKLMNRISNSKQRKIQISQAEYYSLVNILKLFPELKEPETPNKTPQVKKELSPDFIRQIEREILGIE